MSGNRASTRLSSPASSVPRQPGIHGTEDHYVRCGPCEDERTPTMLASHGCHFRNKALSCKFNGLNIPNDRDPRKNNQVGRRSVLNHVLSPGKIHGASGHRNFQDERNHGNHTKLKRKHHSLKIPDPVAYPVSIHPVQPPNLRCKNIVHRESFRQILGGDAAPVPVSESRSPFARQNKKLVSSFKLVCAETSNPDIKISNVDEACGTTFSYVESAENVITDFLRSDLALNKHEESLPEDLPSDGHSLDDTAEYYVIGGLDTRTNRGDFAPCPEVHFTTPDGKELKMERYFPPEEDSIECSIHTCGMSSSMVSGVTLEHEMSPSEKLARVLPRRNTPLNIFSGDTIASMTEKEVIEVHNPNDNESPRVGKFLHRASHTTLSDGRSSNEDDSDNGILNRYLRDSGNDSDYNIRSKVSRAAPQERSLGISDGIDKIVNVRNPRTAETVPPKERSSLLGNDRSPDTFQSTAFPDIFQVIPGTDAINEDMDKKNPDTDTKIEDSCERNLETDTKISSADENESSAFIQLLKTAENVPDTAENIPNTAVTIADMTETILDSAEGISSAAEMILDTSTKTSHLDAIIIDTSCMPTSVPHNISDTVKKMPGMDERILSVKRGCSDKARRFPTEDILSTKEMVCAPDSPDTSDNGSVPHHICTTISHEVERLPKQKSLSPLSLVECKSSSVHSTHGISLNDKHSSRVTTVVLVPSSSKSGCSEKIHSKVVKVPNDLHIDIREQIGKSEPEPSLQKEEEPRDKNDPVVTVGMIRDNETTEDRSTASDRVIVTARTPNSIYATAPPQAVTSKITMLSYQRKSDVPVKDFSQKNTQNAHKTFIHSRRQETMDNAIGLKRAGIQKQGSLEQGYHSDETLEAESRCYRGSTFPIISKDMRVFEMQNFLAEKSVQSPHNKISETELPLTTEVRKNFISNVQDPSAQGSPLLETLSGNDVNCQLGTFRKPSNYSINAECQEGFVDNTKAFELDKSGETATKALKDEVSDNRTSMISGRGERRASDENSDPLKDLIEGSQISLQALCVEHHNRNKLNISPTENGFNQTGVISRSTAVDLQHTSRKGSVCVIPTEESGLLDETFPGLNSVMVEVSADEVNPIDSILPVKGHVNESISCGGRFQSRATQDCLSGTASPFIHRTARYCNDEEFGGENFSRAESFSNGSSVLTPTDESISSEEFTMKGKTQDGSYLTAVFRRDSNDLHSSQENLKISVQSKAVSARTSTFTNPSSDHVSSPTRHSEGSNTGSTSRVYIASQGETRSIVDHGLEINNESNFMLHNTTRFVEYSSHFVKDRNVYGVNSAEVQHVQNIEGVLKQEQKKPAGMERRSHTSFEYQEYAPFKADQEGLTLNAANNQNKLNQGESDGFSLFLQDSEKHTFKPTALQESEKSPLETGENKFGNDTEMSNGNVRRSLDITGSLSKPNSSYTEKSSQKRESSHHQKKNFDSEEVGLDNKIGFDKAVNRFGEGKGSSNSTGKVHFDCEKKNLDIKVSSSGTSNVEKDLDVVRKSLSNIGHCFDSSVKTQEEDNSSSCNHDHSIDKLPVAKKLSQSNAIHKLQYEFQTFTNRPDNENRWKYSSHQISFGLDSDKFVTQQSVRTYSANQNNIFADNRVIMNESYTASQQSDMICDKNSLMSEKESLQGKSCIENVEQHLTKVAPETASSYVENGFREMTANIFRHAVTGIHGSGRELPDPHATIKLGCVQFKDQLVESIPKDSVMNTGAPCSEKVDSSKDDTRETSDCGELRSDSEDPVSMAEPLDIGGFEVEVNEENTTVKSVTDLMEEDMCHECEQRNNNINAENVSLNSSSDKLGEPLTATLQSLGGSPEEEKSDLSNFSAKLSSSDVQMITFDGSCLVSTLLKTNDLSKSIGNQMNVQKSPLIPDMTLKSKNQNIIEIGLSPHYMVPDDEVASYKSFLSLETPRVVTAKGGLRSERSSKGSERVEWTISVNDENGVETQRSVDIITLNDTTEPSDIGRQSNVEIVSATVESPGMSYYSMSSRNTHVLMHPTSPSIGTTRDVSEVACTGVCKTPISSVQSTDETQTRTKLTKKRLDKVETRKRVPLFEEVPGNMLEMYGGERKKKSFMGCSARAVIPDDNDRGKCQRSPTGHSFNKPANKGENSRYATDGYNHKSGKIQNRNLSPEKQCVSNSNGENKFEPYRSISDVYAIKSTRMTSDSEEYDNDVLHSPGQSVSPSLLNLGRFTPSNPSSWSKLRHRQIKSNRTASNVLLVPPTHSRTSNKTSRFLQSDENINWNCTRIDSMRRPRRSDGFPSGSSEQLRCPVSSRPDWNMLTDAPEEPEWIGEVESGAACSASYVPEGGHTTRVVTFENIPSPRSTLRRSTLTPRGESVQTFDPTESCEDTTQPPKSPTPLRFCSEDRFLQVSRLSSDASNCGAEEISSASQMSHKARAGTSTARNPYYEEIPFISMSHESIQNRGVTSEDTNVGRFQTICPKKPGYLSPRRSNAVQTFPTRSHSDVGVLTASKTTLLSLAEACGHSTSRLSSPTPSDIPSPPPNPSPNRHSNHLSQSKVDVAVGVNTLDCDENFGPRISESALPTVHKLNDSTTTIQIPASLTGNHYGSVESENVGNLPVMINFFPVQGISSAGQCLDGNENESKDIPIVVPSNIYQKSIAVSRGVVVTRNAANLLNPPTTPNSSFEADFLQNSVNADERLEIQRSSGKSRCVVSRLRTPPILDETADCETTSASILDARKPESTDQQGGNVRESNDIINTSDNSSHLTPAETEGNKMHRPSAVGGHYRFGLASQRGSKCSDLMDNIKEINPAVPSRSTLSRSSGPTNRLSPNVTVCSQARHIGARIFELSCSATGEDCSSDFKEPHGCHRERESYAQKPRPKLIRRPADSSCRSSTPSKTTNTIKQVSDEAKQKTARSEDCKRPLPPAALDQSEEGCDLKQGPGSFSNAGVITNLPLDNGRGCSVAGSILAPGTSTVRFSENLLKSQAGSPCTETQGHSMCASTAATGSLSYVGPLSSSNPGTAGKSVTSSLRESTGQDVLSMTRHDVSTPTADPLTEQLSPSSGVTAHCGVICPEMNGSNSSLKQNICLSMKFHNSVVPSRNIDSSQEYRMTQTLHGQAVPTDYLGRYSTCVPINENPGSPPYEIDVSSETENSRGTLASQGQIQENMETKTSQSQGQRSSRTSSTLSSNKRKSSTSSHKSFHVSGNKTGRGSVRKHVRRTSSKTVQPKTISLSVLEKSSNPPPTAIDDGGSQPQSQVPRVISHDDCGEEEVSYIAEVSETTEDFPTDRLECEGDCTSIPAPQFSNANAESMVTETLDLLTEALPRSLTKSEDLFARPEAATSSRRMTGLVADMSETSAQSYNSGFSNECASEPATEQDVKSLAMVQDQSARVSNAKEDTCRHLQHIQKYRSGSSGKPSQAKKYCRDVGINPTTRRPHPSYYTSMDLPLTREPRLNREASLTRKGSVRDDWFRPGGGSKK